MFVNLVHGMTELAADVIKILLTEHGDILLNLCIKMDTGSYRFLKSFLALCALNGDGDECNRYYFSCPEMILI